MEPTQEPAAASFAASVAADLPRRSTLGKGGDRSPDDTISLLGLRLHQLMGDVHRIRRDQRHVTPGTQPADDCRAALRDCLVGIASLAQLAARELGVEDEIPF